MKSFLVACIFSVLIYAHAHSADTSFVAYEQKVPGLAQPFTMTPIAGGTFKMGSPASESNRDMDEGPQASLKIAPFWMGTHEITHDLYNLFFTDESLSQNSDVDGITRPSQPYLDFSLGMGREGGFPANSMKQYGAIMFCKWLYQKTGLFYRLPTEAEWEYACRAGSKTRYFFGDDPSALKEYAWYAENSEGKYHKTGLLKPNAWGLYDILGNVAEWTLDQYDVDYFKTIKKSGDNPLIVPTKMHPRTVRGGAYNDAPEAMRSANRIASDLVWNRRDPQIPKSVWWNADAPFVGFRLVRPYAQPTEEEIKAFFALHLGE